MTILQLLPLSISSLALVIATRNYRRKSGVLTRGSFTIAFDRASSDPYLSNLIIENMKDRAVTVFGIYLRVDLRYYIEVESLEAEPLVLRPFDSYTKKYGPIEFYGTNGYRVRMRHLLNDATVGKRLVLSTSDGKYVVASTVRHWNPVSEYFKNHANSILLTVRSTYKGVDLGSEIRYALELIYENGNDEVIPLQIDDYRLAMFRNFQLTQESLQSKEALESFLKSHIDSGNLTCKEFRVLDLSLSRLTSHEFYRDRVADAKRLTRFQYWVLGRLGTYIADRRLRTSQLKPAKSNTSTPTRDTDGS